MAKRLARIGHYSRFTSMRVLLNRLTPMIAWVRIELLVTYQSRAQTMTVVNGLEFAVHTLATNCF